MWENRWQNTGFISMDATGNHSRLLNMGCTDFRRVPELTVKDYQCGSLHKKGVLMKQLKLAAILASPISSK